MSYLVIGVVLCDNVMLYFQWRHMQRATRTINDPTRWRKWRIKTTSMLAGWRERWVRSFVRVTVIAAAAAAADELRLARWALAVARCTAASAAHRRRPPTRGVTTTAHRNVRRSSAQRRFYHRGRVIVRWRHKRPQRRWRDDCACASSADAVTTSRAAAAVPVFTDCYIVFLALTRSPCMTIASYDCVYRPSSHHASIVDSRDNRLVVSFHRNDCVQIFCGDLNKI